MNKVKVCHLTSVHPIDDVRIFVKECTSLAAHGFDVTLIACGDEAFEDVKNGVKRISLHVPVKNRLHRMVKRSRAVYKKALEVDADVYHFHDPELITIGLLLKRKKKTVLFDAHEDVPSQILSKPYLSRLSRYLLSVVFAVFERFTCFLFDAIITATPFITHKFAKINKKVINVNNFPVLNETPSCESISPNAQNQVCFVGLISKIRGLRELVEAMDFITSNTKLVIGGAFSDSLFRKELQLMTGWSKVQYLGFINRMSVNKVLKESFAGLVTFLPLPNHTSSQPNKMFEYMGAGIPVIASNFPLWKQIVEENNCGLCVDPQKPEEIAHAIDYLASNPEIAEQMGKNGRDAVRKKYNWSQEEKKLIQLYNQFAKSLTKT